MDLRRETDISELQDLTFSTNNQYLALCGQENEISVYKIEKNMRVIEDEESKPDKGGFFGGMLGNKKVVGEKLFAKWTIKNLAKKKVAFSSDAKQLICVTMDGSHYSMPIS